MTGKTSWLAIPSALFLSTETLSSSDPSILLERQEGRHDAAGGDPEAEVAWAETAHDPSAADAELIRRWDHSRFTNPKYPKTQTIP